VRDLLGGRAVLVVWARDLGPDFGATIFWAGQGTPWLILSERLATADEIKDTVAHECAHIRAYDLYGNAHAPHGPEWRKIHRRFLDRLTEDD
jgi:hypothetical protein